MSSKSLYCSFCSAGPFVKRAGLISHYSQRTTCSEAALALAQAHITRASEHPPHLRPTEEALLFGNDDIPPASDHGDLRHSPTPSTSRPAKRPRYDNTSISPQPRNYIESCPEEMEAGRTYRWKGTVFEEDFQSQRQQGDPPWFPFADEEEWELADWLMTSEISHGDIDKHLKLKIVSNLSSLSFRVHILTWTTRLDTEQDACIV